MNPRTAVTRSLQANLTEEVFCKGKAGFPSLELAEHAVRRSGRNGKRGRSAYRCRCGHWHLAGPAKGGGGDSVLRQQAELRRKRELADRIIDSGE